MTFSSYCFCYINIFQEHASIWKLSKTESGPQAAFRLNRLWRN